jgi:hypothetical protein
VLQSDAKRKRRKWQESKQETERHMQVTESTQQHQPIQNTAEAKETAQEHPSTGTKESNNDPRHKPEQASPLNSTSNG